MDEDHQSEVLDNLLKQMSHQIENKDTEEAHQTADWLLQELVQHLAKTHSHKENILTILEKYLKVKKWYS